MAVLVVLLCCSAALALPLPDEVDSEETRKVLGSSVVTSVSVLMDLGNGTQALFSNSSGSRVEGAGAGAVAGEVGSPVDMASPDHYQYYSFDGSGNLVKRFMTKEDVSSIIATSHKQPGSGAAAGAGEGVPTYYHDLPGNVGDASLDPRPGDDEALQQSQLRVVASVQNLLKSQISSQGHLRPPMPTHISPEASASWSMILPSFFGNQQDSVDAALDQALPSLTTSAVATPARNVTEEPPTSTAATSPDPPPFSDAATEPTQAVAQTTLRVSTTSHETSSTEEGTNPSTSSAEETTHESSSSESQMLGDAPMAYSPVVDLSTSAESTEHPPSTTSSPTSTGHHQDLNSNKAPELIQIPDVIESSGNDQSTEEVDTSSTVYEIISTSNKSSTTTETPHTTGTKQDSLQEVVNIQQLPSLLNNVDLENVEASDSIQSETVSDVQPNESISTTPVQKTSTSAPIENISSDGSAMMADAPVPESEQGSEQSSTVSQSQEEIPSAGSTEHEQDSTTRVPAGSQHQYEFIKIPSIGSSPVADGNPTVPSEQVPSVSEDVSNSSGAAVDPTSTEYIMTEQTTSSGAQHTDSGEDGGTDASSEASDEAFKLDIINDEHSVEHDDSTAFDENHEYLNDQASFESSENEESMGDEDVTLFSEELSTEPAQAQSTEEMTSAEKPESNERPAEVIEEESTETQELPVSRPPNETKLPEGSASEEDSKLRPSEDRPQADHPHLDKLGEPSNTDFANTLAQSDEDHSSLNLVDLSTSVSKEKIPLNRKNNTDVESVEKGDNKVDEETSLSSNEFKDPSNEAGVESASSTSGSENTPDTFKTDHGGASSDEEPNVSSSPVKTTDTSSSTPEVTEVSEEQEEHGETSSVESTEDVISGEILFSYTTPGGSSLSDDKEQLLHNLDESVASIMSQITSDNNNHKVTPINYSNSGSDEKHVSSAMEDSRFGETDSKNRPSTEIVVTSVSTSKSTEASSSEVEPTSTEHLTEDGSGDNGLCGGDTTCSDEGGANNPEGNETDTDKVSAGSESVGITATFDNPGGNLTSGSSVVTSGVTEPLVQGTTAHPDSTALDKTNPKHDANDGAGAANHATKHGIDSLTTPSTVVTESGEIIPISAETTERSDKPKINETANPIAPQAPPKRSCNNEGSGDDGERDSCENSEDDGRLEDGSGQGSDSYEGSGEDVTHSPISGESGSSISQSVDDGSKTNVTDTEENYSTSNDDLHDIMKYAESEKDIGITHQSSNYDDSKASSEASVDHNNNFASSSERTDELFDSSTTVDYEYEKNMSLAEANSISNSNKSAVIMDLLEYANSNLDIGITNVYNSTETDFTTEPSVTDIYSNETSDADLEDLSISNSFKYVDSDEDVTTEDSQATQPISTDSNEVETTTVYDTDIMMNEQPAESASLSAESFIPVQKPVEHVKNDTDKFKVTTYKPLPQKAQKDDTINAVKQKPHTGSLSGSPGEYSSNLVKQPVHKVKRPNGTSGEDGGHWTQVQVISHEHKNGSQEDVPTSRPQFYSPTSVDLQPAPHESLGLEASTAHLVKDVHQFADLCNELAFKLWLSASGRSSRSLVLSPFAATSLLSMIFLGAKGSTSDQMNDMLKLDDMMTFNPHQVFRNITESVVQSRSPGVRTAAFVRELYSDKSKGPLLDFYKQRVSQFYDGVVEEADFSAIGDVLRRRTNLQVKKQTGGRVPEYLRGSGLALQPPLAAFSANIFQTDCRGASTQGRDGEMYFTLLPSSRQRRLVPIPAAVLRAGGAGPGFLAGYEPGLDATAASLGTQDAAVTTVLVMPGQQGQTAPGDGLARLEARLLGGGHASRAWSLLLRSLLARPGLELQFPRFSHRSLLNLTASLQAMGVNELFDARTADLQGLSGLATAFHLSDLVQVNTFTTCGEEAVGSRHHVEIYPERAGRELETRPRRARLDLDPEATSFEEAVPQADVYHVPLALRPRQARLPDSETPPPRLKFDRPFLYFVRHNPTGFILYMGRFNPRLIH